MRLRLTNDLDFLAIRVYYRAKVENVMANGLKSVDRYSQLYHEYLSNMQQPKYSGNPDEASTEELLRDLYKVICGNGTKRTSIMHSAADNNARLTMASEDIQSVQTTLENHTGRLKTQEETCAAFRTEHLKVISSVKAAVEPPATVVNVNAVTPAVKDEVSWVVRLAQSAKNVKEIAALVMFLAVSIIAILGWLQPKPVTPPIIAPTPDQTAAIVQAILAQQYPNLGKVAKP